jgi:hypothetical protein
MKRPLRLSLQVSVVLALLNAAASAQAPKGCNRCVGHESPDLVVEGCSEIIEEGRQAPDIAAATAMNPSIAEQFDPSN